LPPDRRVPGAGTPRPAGDATGPETLKPEENHAGAGEVELLEFTNNTAQDATIAILAARDATP
jgi:hypothetical protein